MSKLIFEVNKTGFGIIVHMKDLDCTAFLQWCLPQLRLYWPGFRKVRKQVCKRLSRRVNELGLSNALAYRDYLENHPDEWVTLDALCKITISRFYRDRGIFDALRDMVLPSIAKRVAADRGTEIRCWSAGCCSGEEAYTLQILWKLCVMPAVQSELPLRIIATDTNEELLERAQRGCYPESSLGDLPEELLHEAFVHSGGLYSIKKNFAEDIEFLKQDIRKEMPEGLFHLILCRNLAFTYFEEALQQEVLERIAARLLPGGFLVIGIHESLPQTGADIVLYGKMPGIYQKR